MTSAPKHPIFLPLMSNAMLMQIMQPTHTGVWGALRSRRCMPWWRASLTSSHSSSTVNLHEEMLTSIPSSLGSMWWSPQTMQSCLSTWSRSARMGGCSLGRRFNCVCLTHLSLTLRSLLLTCRCFFQVCPFCANRFSATLGWTESLIGNKMSMAVARGNWWIFLHQPWTSMLSRMQQGLKASAWVTLYSVWHWCGTLCGWRSN